MARSHLHPTPHVSNFAQSLDQHRHQIDVKIADFVKYKSDLILQAYGPDSHQAYNAYLSILSRGGKRIRGALTISAYHMFGGQDHAVALQAALVMEMVQAYLLIVDDVCDRSTLRRGGPTTHRLLAQAHQQAGWHDNSEHFGESIAVLAAILGMHEAMTEADAINVAPTAKLAALRNLNQCLSVTAHGQFNDIYAQVKPHTDLNTIEDILVWKTAYYTFVNPLQFGALLAGASEPAIQSLVDYSIHAGKAFQLSDDVIGTFSSTQDTGKSQLDDIKEGKRTLLVALALQQTSSTDAAFLSSMLGNQKLTMEQLARCQHIIKASGAYDQVATEISHSLQTAHQSLTSISQYASNQGIEFLSGLLEYLESRQG